VAVKSSWDISAEPVSGQIIEERVVTDLDQRNDENRPNLTSSAVAEERQDISSKNTIHEMADAVTGGNRFLGPLVSQYTGKNAGILVEIWNRFFLALCWKVIFKTLCSTTQERQQPVTEMHHKSYSSPEPQWRSSWQKLALFFSFTNVC